MSATLKEVRGILLWPRWAGSLKRLKSSLTSLNLDGLAFSRFRLDGIFSAPKRLNAVASPGKAAKVVGIAREAKALGISQEQYLAKWKDAIKHSALTPSVRDSVLSSVDFNSYFGLGVIVIGIPEQSELCYFDGDVYWRSGDSTELADTPQKIVNVAKRF